MIAVDTNILVYATIPSCPTIVRQKSGLDARLNGFSPVGLPWHVLVGFLRLVTNPRMVPDTHLAAIAIEHGLPVFGN